MLYQNIMYGRVGKDWFRYCQSLFAARAKCNCFLFDYSKPRPPKRRCERKPVWVVWEHLWPTPAAHTTSNYLTHCFDHLRRLLWWAVTVLQNLNILTNDACNGLRTSGVSPIVCIPQSSAHPGTPPISTRFVLYHNQRFSWPYFRPIFKNRRFLTINAQWQIGQLVIGRVTLNYTALWTKYHFNPERK